MLSSAQSLWPTINLPQVLLSCVLSATQYNHSQNCFRRNLNSTDNCVVNYRQYQRISHSFPHFILLHYFLLSLLLNSSAFYSPSFPK